MSAGSRNHGVPLRLALALLATSTVLVLVPRTAEAHVPPPAFLTWHIADDAVTVEVAAQIGLVRDWVGIEPRLLRKPGPLAAEHLARIEAEVGAWLEVRVDGAARPLTFTGGRIEAFEDHATTWRYARVAVRVPTTVPPKQVELVWRRYADDTNYLFEHIDVELDAYDTMRDVQLTAVEPSHVWHRPATLPPDVPVSLPSRIEAPRLEIPALSLLILLIALGWIVVHRRTMDTQRRLTILGMALAAGSLLLPVGRVDLRATGLFGATEVTRPGDDEALATFASLHRGLYAAVGEADDEGVYDRLAPIVDAPLLPRLYLDIHQSMIMQAQGGAVARIRKTDLVSTELLPAPDDAEAPWFVVRARWRVEGRVGHWGHTHHRVNEYLADVTVRAVDGRWKIARIDTLDQTRVDDGGADGR